MAQMYTYCMSQNGKHVTHTVCYTMAHMYTYCISHHDTHMSSYGTIENLCHTMALFCSYIKLKVLSKDLRKEFVYFPVYLIRGSHLSFLYRYVYCIVLKIEFFKKNID